LVANRTSRSDASLSLLVSQSGDQVGRDVFEQVFDDEGGVEEIDHTALMHGDGMGLIESERPEELHGSHSGRAWVDVAVGDVDGHHQRAKAAGVDVLNEPHTAMGGAQRGYSARDFEGNLWSFGTARPER
jgi:uncharacterized glyoxalase superfamily protein PhnB